MAPNTWVLQSSGFATDPDPLAVTFVVGTAIADDIIESLQTRFPELQHSRRSWREYSTNQRSGHVQMVCDARRGTLPEQQRAVIGAAHEIMLRCIERLERACHNGALTKRYDADQVMEMRRILDDASEDSAVSEQFAGYAFTKFSPGLNAVNNSPPTRQVISIEELEAQTPPFHRDSALWVRNTRAAKLEGVETETLKSYRYGGVHNTEKTLGRDPDGRVWRRPGTSNSHPWYLRSTLKSEQPNRGKNRGFRG